jgi:hypothetical protein
VLGATSIVIRFVDIVAGSLVILALALKLRSRWVWGIYLLACWTYMGVNFYKGLPGQAVMNLVAGGIAAWNIISWKSVDSGGKDRA